jgi:aminopeptidase N
MDRNSPTFDAYSGFTKQHQRLMSQRQHASKTFPKREIQSIGQFMRTKTPQTIYLDDYKPSAFLIKTVELDICLHHTKTRVISTLSIEYNDKTERGTSLVLDGDELQLKSVKLDGHELDAGCYQASKDGFTLFEAPDKPFKLTFETEINPTENTKLMGLYRSKGTYCTQCEAEGFRRITYFLDRPDILSVYTVRMEALKEECPVLLSNGNMVEQSDMPDTDSHYAIWHDPHPKPCYLFALVAGRLGHISDYFKTGSGRHVRIAIYVEPGKESQADYAMDSLKRCMKWDEDVYGLEYDLDVFNIVAVSDFNLGAMENKGLNIFNDKYILASPETATDTDYANIEAIIAHEYFHNWTGNRITCRDWFQLCLKEGLTVYRDQEFSSDMRSRAVKRIADVRTLWSRQFPEDAGPLAHPVRPQSYKEINNFYTATVYEKGAEIIRVLETILGRDIFMKGLQLYFKRHDGDAATVEQFLACFEDVSGQDLTAMIDWYNQAGTPEVTIETRWEPDKQGDYVYIVKTSQKTQPTPGQAHKKVLPLPIEFGLIDPQEGDINISTLQIGPILGTIKGNVFVAEQSQSGFVVKGLKKAPYISPLRNFSAPARLKINRSEEELGYLARFDTDAFNRWRAMHDLATGQLVKATHAIRSDSEHAFDDTFMHVFSDVLKDQTIEHAFKAQLLSLPTETDIAREMRDNVDPDAIYKAKKSLLKHLADHLNTVLLDVFHQAKTQEAYSPDQEQSGRRSLRLATLMIASALQEQKTTDLTFQLFETADNMTERYGALSILIRNGLDKGEQALQIFHDRFADNSLVLDKWFSIQATAPRTDSIDQLYALMRHPGFSLNTPNRVQAVVGAFAVGNFTQFNREDGRGYAFVAEQVLKIDRLNPQLAARLLSSFRSWRALEPKRREMARIQLERIRENNELSRDVSDIINRSLGNA